MNRPDPIFDYCAAHTSAQQPVLADLERATYLRTLSPHMLSGSYQGRLLQMISQMIKPRRVLEIGTFTGYAAICLAQGLADDGLVHTIEVNDELTPIIYQYLHSAGLSDRVRVHVGDAAAIIPTLDDLFDLVFLDAGKLDYPQHYELALARMQPGGFLLADNVLWDQRVINPDDHDATVTTLRQFNDFIAQDERVDNLLLPLRDGLMVVRKK